MRLPRGLQVLLALGLTVTLAGILGFRFNLTRSLPVGIYRSTAEAAMRGSIVHVCLPRGVAELARERGYLGPGSCASGVRPLGKVVLALEGDLVTLRPGGIRVNGVAIPHSATAPHDSRGRALPHPPWGDYRLHPGQLWLHSPYHPNAFDSRYFGPVEAEHVVSVLRPVWTWSFQGPGQGTRARLASGQASALHNGGPLHPGGHDARH